MSEEKKKGEELDAEDFDLQLELSSLVADRVIPQSIAEKLEQKIVEKQFDITKKQLYTIAEKIHSLIQTYKENGSLPDAPKQNQTNSTSNEDLNEVESKEQQDDDSLSDDLQQTAVDEFMNKIEELQQKINHLEQGKPLGAYHQSSPENIELPYDESFSTDHLTNADPLKSINPNPENIIVLMNWLQYLVNRCGPENLADVLDYYVEVDWITDDVKISLLEYATGINDGAHSDKETKDDKNTKTSKLPSKDHIQSYLYIQRLKGRKFQKHFVERINGELARIEKKVDMYHHTR